MSVGPAQPRDPRRNLAPLDGQHVALVSLGRRWLQFHAAEILELDMMIRTLVRATAPALMEAARAAVA